MRPRLVLQPECADGGGLAPPRVALDELRNRSRRRRSRSCAAAKRARADRARRDHRRRPRPRPRWRGPSIRHSGKRPVRPIGRGTHPRIESAPRTCARLRARSWKRCWSGPCAVEGWIRQIVEASMLLTVGPATAVRVHVLMRPAAWRKTGSCANGHSAAHHVTSVRTRCQTPGLLESQNPSPLRHSRETGVSHQTQFPLPLGGRQAQNIALGGTMYAFSPHGVTQRPPNSLAVLLPA